MKIKKGFIAGRFLGEKVRLIYDVLFESMKQNLPSLLLSINFEKAFDTSSWKFIMKVLDYFNFGSSVKTWVGLLKHVFYKTTLCQILFVYDEDADRTSLVEKKLTLSGRIRQ